MKKGKQILAILGILVLVGMYLATLLFAILGKENTMNLLMASVYATIVIPVLIWVYERLTLHMMKSREDNLEATLAEDAETESATNPDSDEE